MNKRGVCIISSNNELKVSRFANLKNDCGCASVQMICDADGIDTVRGWNIEDYRCALGKGKNPAATTLPNHLCKFFHGLGYGVQYHSALSWARCRNSPCNGGLQGWDPKVASIPEPFLSESLGLDRLQICAEELVAMDMLCPPLEIPRDLQGLLQNGRRIIAMVRGSHYVLVKGCDAEGVYVLNAEDGKSCIEEVVPWKKFSRDLAGPLYESKSANRELRLWNEVFVLTPPNILAREKVQGLRHGASSSVGVCIR